MTNKILTISIKQKKSSFLNHTVTLNDGFTSLLVILLIRARKTIIESDCTYLSTLNLAEFLNLFRSLHTQIQVFVTVIILKFIQLMLVLF